MKYFRFFCGLCEFLGAFCDEKRTAFYRRGRKETRYLEAAVGRDEEQILKLFEDGDSALIAADLAELSRIFAEDYVQRDECGRAFTKRDVIENLTSGRIRYISMTSTGRKIRRIRDDVAIVNGSEEDEVEQDGRRLTVRYVYADVVLRRDGKWQIVASQLARDCGRN